MEIRNNNQTIEQELAKIYYKKNGKKNGILIVAIAMSVFLLYTAFSIADGKIRSDYLIDVRGMGTLATVSLEKGTSEQFEQMKELTYLAEVGIKKTVVEGTEAAQWKGNLVYVDKTAYEKLFRPAFTDICGFYPTKENEIMLPERCFEQIGIGKPKLGMKIPIEIELENGQRKIYDFYVSGYYTDYIDAAVSLPEAFISKVFMEKMNVPLFPADKIMATQSTLDESEVIERRLYFDITMEYDSQQVFSENPMAMQSVEGVFGSISIAVGCGIIVVLCAFMLIYNVVSISMGKDIRQYGLLKVLGTTNRQLRRIAYRQNIWNIVIGNIFGGSIGIICIKLFLQNILQRLFMHGLGKSDVSGFYVHYLLIAILLVSVTTFCATAFALRQVIKWNAINSIKYVEADVSYHKKCIRTTNNMGIAKIAWRNITRTKKRLLISICSLLVGCIMALGVAVIMNGTDITNKIKEFPDFQFGILAGIFRHPEKVPEEINDNTQIISPEVIQAIEKIDGVKQQTIEQTRGTYAVIDFNKDEALQPRKESIDDLVSNQAFATIQIVDGDYISKLEEYVVKNKMDVDIESLKEGTGCLLLHHNEMSQILNEKTRGILGMPIHFYSLSAYGTEGSLDSYKQGDLACAGYMDMTAKYFPQLQTTSIGNRINYFIVSEAAFKKLGFSEKIFDVSFEAEEENEVVINQKLSQILQQENVKSGEMDTFYLNTNYLLLQAEQNRISTANTILSGLVISILAIGIMNFCNTLVANRSMRKREIAIMESIGLTRKQLYQMTFMEGLYYWLIIMFGLLTLGSITIWILGMGIKQKLLYFKFIYPWETVLFLAVVLLMINLILAQISYCKDRKQSLSNRIKI